MTDIIERLRHPLRDTRPSHQVMEEAADEIERLQLVLGKLVVEYDEEIERLLASRCQCDDECALSIENEKLRAQWRDSDPEKLFAENQSLHAERDKWSTALIQALTKADNEIKRLRDEVESWKAEARSMHALAWQKDAEIERLRARIKELETSFLPDRPTGGT